MKTVTTRPSFQGDLMLIEIAELPANCKPAAAESDYHILAHSETGHHHVLEAGAAQRFIDETNAFISYLKVNKDAAVEHLRDHDTHEPLGLTEGKFYKVVNGREDAWAEEDAEYRRAAD